MTDASIEQEIQDKGKTAARFIDHQSVGICLNCGAKGITYHEEAAILIDGKVITS